MPSRLAALLLTLLLIISLMVRSPTLYLLEALTALMLGASAVWSKYCLAGVSYVRRFSAPRLFCGETVDVWVELVNAKPLPLAWLSAADDFPADISLDRGVLAPSSDPQRRTLNNVFSLRWYERVRRHYRLTAHRRGLFEFGPVALSSGDLFGFRVRYLDVPQVQTLLVYPKVVPLEQLGLQSARPLGDQGARRRFTTDPLRLAGTRDYLPGDPLRHVHWKATARRGQLQTKMFDPSVSQQLLIFLNGQTLERAYEGVISDYLETAIVVAASLALAGLDAQHPVGLFTNGTARLTHRRVRLPASRHAAQSTQILEILAQLTPFTFMSFDEVLRLEMPDLPLGATIIAVTAVITEAILSSLLDVRAKGHPVVLICVGEVADTSFPADFDAPIYRVRENWTDLETVAMD